VPPHVNHRPMTTRVKRGFRLPANKLTLSATSSSLLSLVHTFVLAALIDPSWCHVMKEEYDALITNNTWDLVPHPVGSNVFTGKWIFMHKFNSNGRVRAGRDVRERIRIIPPVRDVHPPRHRLRRIADLPSYARSLRASPHHDEVHIALSTRLPALRPPPATLDLLL
jgi:hypothetical protein